MADGSAPLSSRFSVSGQLESHVWTEANPRKAGVRPGLIGASAAKTNVTAVGRLVVALKEIVLDYSRARVYLSAS